MNVHTNDASCALRRAENYVGIAQPMPFRVLGEIYTQHADVNPRPVLRDASRLSCVRKTSLGYKLPLFGLGTAETGSD